MTNALIAAALGAILASGVLGHSLSASPSVSADLLRSGARAVRADGGKSSGPNDDDSSKDSTKSAPPKDSNKNAPPNNPKPDPRPSPPPPPPDHRKPHPPSPHRDDDDRDG